MATNIPDSKIAAGAYGVSAGLDLLSGVFGFIQGQANAAALRSRADLIRSEAEAQAQRYQEQAQFYQAHEKVVYLASGVTLQGSPVDALATSARNANENIAAILMEGERSALNAENGGVEQEAQGRAALVGGLTRGTGMGIDSYIAGSGGSKSKADLGALAELLGGSK